MNKMKISIKLIMLIVLPAALIDTINGLYNVYMPIYLQAGNPLFDGNSATLTFGFGVGAALVGFWMTADNIAGFLIQPIIAAWSDRTKHRLGRRLPFILFTTPFLLIGCAIIPVIPTLIPPDLNGQQAKLVGLFIIFTTACVIYYMGFIPQRVILQTLRQEVIDVKDRPKVESWYTFLMYFLTIIGYTAGGLLYKIYGPLLLWAALGIYALSIAALMIFFREPQDLADSAKEQESSNLKQLLIVFKGRSSSEAISLGMFLGSLVFYTLASSGLGNFATSWMVNVLGLTETKAVSTLSIYTIGAALASLPAGYIASSKFGRKNLYTTGLFICMVSTLLIGFFPQVYLVGLTLFGIGQGISLVTMLPLATELFQNDKSMGSVVGVFNTAYLFGFLLGANIIGWIIQIYGYKSCFLVTGAFLTISFCASIFIKKPQNKSLPTQTSVNPVETVL